MKQEDDSREETFIFVEEKKYVRKCCLKWNDVFLLSLML